MTLTTIKKEENQLNAGRYCSPSVMVGGDRMTVSVSHTANCSASIEVSIDQTNWCAVNNSTMAIVANETTVQAFVEITPGTHIRVVSAEQLTSINVLS